MEPAVSAQEIAVYQTLGRGEWMTVKQIAQNAGVVNRTTRHHLRRFIRLGFAEETAAVFPGRYRLTAKAPRLEAAAAVINSGRSTEVESVMSAWSRRE